MSSSGTMNRLEFDENDLYQEPEISQRWQAAITTIILLALVSYGWQYLSYETTIKRTLYEVGTSIIPTRFVQLLHTSARRITSLPNTGSSGAHHDAENNSQAIQQVYDGAAVSSVVQRARSLSGFGTKTIETTFAGLGNWDNSCFQNSVLQGLATLQAFRTFVEESVYLSTIAAIEAPTYEGLKVFLSQLQQELASRNTLWPPSVLRSMNTWQQQDAQEYFSKIMDAIEKESGKYQNAMAKRLAPGLDCLRPHNWKESDIPVNEAQSDMDKMTSILLPPNPLDGSLSQVLRCQKCGFSEGISLIPLNCLTLNLGLGGNCELENLLDAYTAPELIEGVECDECTRLAKVKIDAGVTARKSSRADGSSIESDEKATNIPKVLSTKAKRVLFGRLPHDLVVHINRSIFDDWGNQRKNNSFVSFPPTLEIVDDWMTPLSDEGSDIHAVYELRCIVTHQGRHDNGHYVACGKRGKEWYSFNDEIVSRITEEQVLGRGHVFMLFYEMVDRKAVLEITPPSSPSLCQHSSESSMADARPKRSDSVNHGAEETNDDLDSGQIPNSDVTLVNSPAVFNSEFDPKLSASLTE
ncbi:hypothetical protein LTR70_004198 [Exophiala xenobiotica]|uniref:ubiquitinyl hydrolase 1 n=1 Tax=Lithohypha guttulata TaxID=1690604 RepID=A0ABR0KG74_9EURO|nr:hypothetical protein LTR24_003680 [Lithohypha guttulata]KAK5321485.1 hypothetical protein LTR70_004198 [Exophiala xenobiotica]